MAPGIVVRWDPALPYRCGTPTLPERPGVPTWVAAVEHLPWLRLAAVTALDRMLYLPLDRWLLDAEVATARLTAAHTLSADEPVREVLVRKALVGARAAARGVVVYLERLAAGGRRPPPVLAAALVPLIGCYSALTREVRESDMTLESVVEAWHDVCVLERAAPRGRRVITPPAPTASTVGGAAQIDPRSVPARLLRFGPMPGSAEIGVDPVGAAAGPAVRVRVEAFSSTVARDEMADVGVRLVDRRSGAVRGYGLLGQPADRRPHFEGLVSLPPALAAPDVRVELFGMADDPPPVDDHELRRVRRATLFLSEWRALVADVRLWGVRARPAARLGGIVRRVTDDVPNGVDESLWSGGPSRSQLTDLVELGDRALSGLLRSGRPAGDGVTATVSGPGDLLAAEVAAAYDQSRTGIRPLREGKVP